MHYYSLKTLYIDSLEIAQVPIENTITMDIAHDGQTMFLTTLHFKSQHKSQAE